MKKNHIYLGDCCEILAQKIPSNSIDLIFADPPYNLSGSGLKWEEKKYYMVNEEWDKMAEEEYSSFTKAWVGESCRALKEKGSIYISCTYHNLPEIMITLKQCQLKINNLITWYKPNAMPNLSRRVFTHATEFILWAVKGKGWVFNYEEIKKINPERQKNNQPKQMRDFWVIPFSQGKERLKDSHGRAIHPTQKPEELLHRILTASSHEGDMVLDPFLGSGTTAVVAQRLNRSWIGIEREKKYLEAAKKRLKEEKLK